MGTTKPILAMTTPASAAQESLPKVVLLESGFWHVWWSAEIWAQWPAIRLATSEDFFHPDFTATPARIRKANEVTGNV